MALISNANWPPSAHHAENISRVQQRAHAAGGCFYFGFLLPSFVEAHQIDSSAVEVEVAVYAGWHRRRTCERFKTDSSCLARSTAFNTSQMLQEFSDFSLRNTCRVLRTIRVHLTDSGERCVLGIDQNLAVMEHCKIYHLTISQNLIHTYRSLPRVVASYLELIKNWPIPWNKFQSTIQIQQSWNSPSTVYERSRAALKRARPPQ